jgi:hypothetical protein
MMVLLVVAGVVAVGDMETTTGLEMMDMVVEDVDTTLVEVIEKVAKNTRLGCSLDVL